MTVEHARTLHSPNQHIHTLNDRVWRLERDRCDCTKIPTSQPKDIVLEKPSPPPQTASSILYGRRLSDSKLVRLNNANQFEETGLQFSGSYLFSGFVMNGWTAWYHPDFWDDTAPKLYIKHIEGRYPDKILVIRDPAEKDLVRNITVWGETSDSIAVFGQLIPKSASGEVEITKFGPTYSVCPGRAYRYEYDPERYTFYSISGGQIVAGDPLSLPTHERWSSEIVENIGVIRYTGSREYPGSNRVRLWVGSGPFTYRGEANGVMAISTKHLLRYSARVEVIDGLNISGQNYGGDISSALSVGEIRQAGPNGIAIREHGGTQWSLRTGNKYVMLDGTQVRGVVDTTGLYVFDGYLGG